MHRRQIGIVLALSIFSTSLSLFPPYLTKFLIDDGLVTRRSRVIVTVCLSMVAFSLCATLLQTITLRLHTRISGRVLFGLRTHVFAHLLALSPDWHARHSIGDTLSRLDGDISEIQRYAIDTLLTTVNAVLALSVSVVLMLSLDVRLTAIVALVIPGQLLCLRLLRRRIFEQSREVRESASKIAAFLYDGLASVKFIQASNSQTRRIRSLDDMTDTYLDSVVRLKLSGLASVAVPGLITTVSMATVFIIGGYQLVRGATSVGTLIALSTYVTRATAPLTNLLALYVSSRRIQVSFERIQSLLTAIPAVAPPAIATALPVRGMGMIAFEGVYFAYPLGTEPVLRNAALIVPGGSKVGIVGRSGSGKTTVVDLLVRYYDPQRGCIRLDGVPLPQLDLAELRRAVAVVAQDPTIVAATVAENIAIAFPDAPREVVMDAARAARIHDDIAALPAGYDTVLNTRGDVLSGGQRQRLALARIFLQRPRLLILDEATSAVDSRAAEELDATVDQMFAGVTRIVISHRAEPLRNVNALYVVENGQFRPLGAGNAKLLTVGALRSSRSDDLARMHVGLDSRNLQI